MSERNPYEFEKIPDFAMQPAREDIDEFDPTVYERLLAGLEVLEPEAVEGPKVVGEGLLEPLPGEMSVLEPLPVSANEELPVSEVAAEAVEKEVKEELVEPTVVPIPAATASPAVETASPEPTPSEPEGVVVLAGDAVVLDSLRLVDMIPCEPMRIRVEEDILVPDVKPDLASILNMDGIVQFTERERKISGDLTLQTLYVPQGKGSDRSIIAIESRIPFQQVVSTAGSSDREGEALRSDAEDIVGMKASARIESLEYSVINERKFRVQATILVEGRRYRNRKLELFEGLKGDEVQRLQEKLVVTDVILRKTELLEVEEDLMIPDSMPQVGKILRCDVNLVENHKQISREKAVISGTAYYNIMYLPLETPSLGQPGGAGVAAAGDLTNGESGTDGEPVLFQAKGEFTQFISLGRLPSSPKARENSLQSDGNLSGRTFFQLKKSTAEAKDDEGGNRNLIHVKVEGETFAELYRDVERQVVMDAYHHQKEMVFDRTEEELVQLCPGGIGETTVREVISAPETVGGVKRVAFLSGDLRRVKSCIENGKNVTEGVVTAKLVCLAENSEGGRETQADRSTTPFRIERELPFRVALELPLGANEAVPDNEVKLKELRFDRLNDRQIELNATVMVNGAVICKKSCPVIRNVGFLETNGPEREKPGLVLYITRKEDSLWKIARKYRTTIDDLTKINGVDGNAVLAPGTKLLIVK